MRILLYILLVSAFTAPVYSQYTDAYRDSIRTILSGEISDSERFDAYLEIAKSYLFTAPDSSLFYGSLIKQKITDLPEDQMSAFIGKAGHIIASAYFYKGQYDMAECELNAALEQTAGKNIDGKITADLYRVLGIVEGAKGNYEVSIEYFFKAQSLYKELGLLSDEQAIRNNIGVTRMKLRAYDEALKIFETLRNEEIHNPRISFSTSSNLAFIYFELDMIDEAEEMIEEAFTFGAFNLSANPGLYFLRGEISLKNGELKKAEDSFKKAIEMFGQRGNDIQKVRPLLGLAKLSRQQGNKKASITYSEQARDIAESGISYPEMNDVYQYLYEYHREIQDIGPALHYLEKWKTVSDSLNNSRINEQVGRVTALYEFSEREQNILEEQQRREFESQLILERQRFALYGTIFSLFLAGGVIFMQRRNAKQRKLTNMLLNRKNEEYMEQATALDQTNKVKDHLFSIIAHDLRGPLSSLHGMLTLIEMNAGNRDELDNILTHVNSQFQHTSTLLTNLLNWSHTQMQGYRTSPLEFDLRLQCKQKSELFRERLEEKKVGFHYPDDPMMVYVDRDMMDVVLQNLISNAIKFCSAGDSITVSYSFSEQQNEAKVTVSDTGAGMTGEAIERILSEDFFSTRGTNDERGTGLGLMLCRDFISRNNGRLTIDSESGKGSTFSVILPLHE